MDAACAESTQAGSPGDAGTVNLNALDWTIVVAGVAGVRLASLRSWSYLRGVADFLSANRLANRYLLTIAGEMGNTGVITLVATWQAFLSAGLSTTWWSFMLAPLPALFALTGWVYYRLRETNCLTVAQFLEERYGRRFRAVAGMLCFTSGLVNFGIFPAVAARFIIYFSGLPDQFYFLGWRIATFPILMAADLLLALLFVSGGGQISILLTECVQGMAGGVAYFVVALAALALVPWRTGFAALAMTAPDRSMIDPFHAGGVRDFNAAYYLIAMATSIYTYQTWLGGQGFMTCARTPHEQKMGKLLAPWRSAPLTVMTLVLPIAAVAVLRLPAHAHQAVMVHAALSQIANPAVRSEMTVPVALGHLLPSGVRGLFLMAMVFLSFTCHDTYMHSWGSIFVQDVVMPLRRREMRRDEQIRWLRASMTFVALFGFLFSLLFRETDKILFFFAITGTIWGAGAGAVMIGGLYSRFGTAQGAYAALSSGAVIGIGGLTVMQWWNTTHAQPFPLNGQRIAFCSCIVSAMLYIAVSYASGGGRRPFDLERLLHRAPGHKSPAPAAALDARWREMLGLGAEFSSADRAIAIATAAWTLLGAAVFIAVMAVHFLWNALPDRFWPQFWRIYAILLLVQCPVTLAWFTAGGLKDMRSLLRDLRNSRFDESDDGRVRDERSESIADDNEGNERVEVLAAQEGPIAPTRAAAIDRAMQSTAEERNSS